MDLENFPTNETAKQMLGTVTGNGFYDRSYIAKWIFQVMGQEIEAAKQYVEGLPEQAFPKSATWGILHQEQKYGIPENTGMTLEERRRQIMIQKVLSPMNPAFLERQIGRIIGHGRVAVIENNPEYAFRVEIMESDTTAASYPDVRKFVRKVKPSHLTLLIVGRYWSEFPVDIAYDSYLHMFSEFFPRNNLQYLFLDGSWDLNGEYVLGGYKTGALADFYPVRVGYLSSYRTNGNIGGGRLQIAGSFLECLEAQAVSLKMLFEARIEEDYLADSRFQSAAEVGKNMISMLGISGNVAWEIDSQGIFLRLLSESKMKESYLLSTRLQGLCKVNKKADSLLEIGGNVETDIGVEEASFTLYAQTEISEEYDERLSSVSYCGAEITSGSRLRVEVDLWYLDGAESLDGSHSLKAEIIEYSADEL